MEKLLPATPSPSLFALFAFFAILGQVSSVEQDTHCQVTEDFLNLWQKPKIGVELDWLKHHPKQPNSGNLPFNPTKVYESSVSTQKFPREWISYNEGERKLHCFICLAFSSDVVSPFGVAGVDASDLKHLYSRISEHELSKSHDHSVQAYLLAKKSKGNIRSILDLTAQKIHDKQVLQNRHIMHCVVDVICFLSAKGLAYRGPGNSEAMYKLDEDINHGNFLDMIRVLAKYDKTLNSHLERIVQKAKAKKKIVDASDSLKRARASRNTFLSKTTVETVYNIISRMIKDEILKEIELAGGKFGIMIDSTQDISAKDQVAVVIRYTLDEPKERLLSMVPATGGSGEELFQLVKKELERYKIPLANCIADATDGAANCSGIYNGFQAKLKEVIPNHVHLHCYAHVLNLVICDACKSVQAIKLFGFAQKLCCFFRDSYKRMDVWSRILKENKIGQKQGKRLQMIGETRWSSKARALTRIYGSFEEPSSALYVEIAKCLHFISSDAIQNSSNREQAANLLEKLLQYEVTLTAMTFLRLFRHTTPLSDYLQTAGMDYAQAWKQVENALEQLKKESRDFKNVENATDKFVASISSAMAEDQDLQAFNIETCLPERAASRKKVLPGELALGAGTEYSGLKKFEINVYNVVYDATVQSIDKRFSGHKDLYNDLSLLCPTRFHEIERNGVPKNGLSRIVQLLGETAVDKVVLSEELADFAACWPRLKGTDDSSWGVSVTDDFDENDDSDNEDSLRDALSERAICQKDALCNNCPSCIHRFLYRYNFHSAAYRNLFQVYKLAITLPVTQVSCERVFSKLKIIKTRLRSVLTDENLESLALISVETKLLKTTISSEAIIDAVAESSQELRRLLLR